MMKYRIVVGGTGMVYDGESKSEAMRQFRLFVIQSKTATSNSAGKLVTLFKNYAIIKEYLPPDEL